MSRGVFRFVVAAVIVAGGLTLAAPRAEAAGREVRNPDLWSLALDWAADVWRENIVGIWEAEGWMIDPNGQPQAVSPEDGEGSGGEDVNG